MEKRWRHGAEGALLDEYEKAIEELIQIIQKINNHELVQILDLETKDPDCKSIQHILTHVVQSGYTYAIEIRNWNGDNIAYREKEFFKSSIEYSEALNSMFHFTEAAFLDNREMELTNFDPAKKIKVRWGQLFDVEQLMQHAIVHVLRHRRQVENMIKKLNT